MDEKISVQETRAMLDVLMEEITQRMNEYTKKTGVIINHIEVEKLISENIQGKKHFVSYRLSSSGDIISELV